MGRPGHYTLGRHLGSGHFGHVYLAKRGARQCFAIKKVTNTEKNTATQEITILKAISHPCIIKYYDHFMEQGVMCLVLEYADKGTFEQQVKAGRLDRREWCVWRFIGHMAAGLEYLHSLQPRQILHRDLKPDNILGFNEASGPGERGTAVTFKLADFGVAKLLRRDAQAAYYSAAGSLGLPAYLSPEVYEDFETYSAGADMWSLGCVIAFYMRQGRHVFQSKEEVTSYRAGHASERIFDTANLGQYSGELLELVYSLVQVTTEERPAAEEVLARVTPARQESGRH
jgi:serine/threonine protein kinase